MENNDINGSSIEEPVIDIPDDILKEVANSETTKEIEPEVVVNTDNDIQYKDTYTVGDISTANYMYTPPIAGYNTILEYTSIINEDVNMDRIKKSNGKKDELYYSSIMNTINGGTKVIPDDPFNTLLKDGVFVQGMEFGNKTISPKKLSVASTGKSAVLAKISKSIASGENIQMPLWHSGFWITIKPPTSTELSILKRDLDKGRLKLGRDSGGLLYSNNSILLYRIAVDFILSKCVNTTIELEDGEDIRDFIYVEDVPLMILAVAISLYPNGFKTTIGCANNAIFVEETGEPLCTFLETAVMDLETLFRVDKRRIDNYMLETLANRQPGSVSKLKVAEYRKRISKNVNTTITKTESGDEIHIKYGSVSLSEYFFKGQLWIDTINKKVEHLVFDDGDDKDEVIDDLVTTSILGIYNTFVSEIAFNEEIISDEHSKLEVLEMLSSDDDMYTDFFAGVKKFLGDTPIAVVATTNFICPECRKERSPITGDNNWDNYIVLDPLNYFLDLITLRLHYKTKR